jgi:hypothetical protein
MPSDPPVGTVRQCAVPNTNRWSGVLLAILAAALFVDSIATVFILPQAPGRMAEPSVALIPALWLWRFVVSLPLPVPSSPHQLALTLLVASTLKFTAYALAVYLAWTQPYSRRRLVLLASAGTLFFLISACALPNINRDIYNYIVSGRVAAVHGANPYDVAPDRFPTDPIYPYASPRYTSFPGDNKFPAWMLLNVGLAALGGEQPVANLLIYRGAFLLFNVANLVLIATILRAVQPRRVLAGVVLYAWNPIVIAYGQSKVDTVMLFFVLLGALALVRGRQPLAIVALVISALVKLITLPLAAVCWLAVLRRRGWRELAVITPVIALTVAACYAPFWHGFDLLGVQLRMLESVRASGPDLFRQLSYTCFAGVVLWVGLTRDGRIEPMLRGWAILMILFALFLSRIGFSWYLISVIGVASLAIEWRIALVMIPLSAIAYLANMWDSASNETVALPMLLALPRFPTYMLATAVIAFGVAAVEVARRARQRPRPEYQLEQQ